MSKFERAVTKGKIAEFPISVARRGNKIHGVITKRAERNLKTVGDQMKNVRCRRIAVLGSDCAVGKRTMAAILAQTLLEQGIKATMIGANQMAWSPRTHSSDIFTTTPTRFCPLEFEKTIVRVCEAQNPDVIIVEGQGAVSHQNFATPASILQCSAPEGVILQYTPNNVRRCDFNTMAMPTPAGEIKLIEAFFNTKVIGLTINNENLTAAEVDGATAELEDNLGIPVANALSRSSSKLVSIIADAFPELRPLDNCA